MKQGPSESNNHYLERFKSNISSTLADTTPEEVVAGKERSKAILLLKNSDDSRYQTWSANIRENTFLDRDKYPTTISDMYELMVKTSSTDSNNNKS